MKKIIIIEDDSDIRQMYAQLLRDAHFEVDESADGRSQELLADKEYDVILLDLVFPNQDGLEILRKIKTKGSTNFDTPVIILTNLDKGEKTKEAMKLGADLCLVKVYHTPRQVFKEVLKYLQE